MQIFTLKHSLIHWYDPVLSIRYWARFAFVFIYVPAFELLNEDKYNVPISFCLHFALTFFLFCCVRPFFNVIGLNNTDHNLRDEMREQEIVYNKYKGTHSGDENIEMAVG